MGYQATATDWLFIWELVVGIACFFVVLRRLHILFTHLWQFLHCELIVFAYTVFGFPANCGGLAVATEASGTHCLFIEAQLDLAYFLSYRLPKLISVPQFAQAW